MRNTEEALLALALYQQLRAECIEQPRRAEVGIVTPYRQQRAHLLEVFRAALGEDELADVKIETVDSFQGALVLCAGRGCVRLRHDPWCPPDFAGKQLDVVILSCVRAKPESTTVGFLADVRRMNVAITRAKRALWILGNAQTLRISTEWHELMLDARQRGLLISPASAEGLFPSLTGLLSRAREGIGRGMHGRNPRAQQPPPPPPPPRAAVSAAQEGPQLQQDLMPPPPLPPFVPEPGPPLVMITHSMPIPFDGRVPTSRGLELLPHPPMLHVLGPPPPGGVQHVVVVSNALQEGMPHQQPQQMVFHPAAGQVPPVGPFPPPNVPQARDPRLPAPQDPRRPMPPQ